jgi:glutamate-1-semialdehyde 2,1-aminomutase
LHPGLKDLEGLKPDMTTLGKFPGGGITFGAFGGREEVMRVYDPRESKALGHSATSNNNTLGMAAGHFGLSKIYTPEVCREFNAMGDRFRQKLEDISQCTRMTVTELGTIMGMHFLKGGKKDLKSFRDRQEDEDSRRLFWFEIMKDGFWMTERGSIVVILGTPWEDLERFVDYVKAFIERHEVIMRL